MSDDMVLKLLRAIRSDIGEIKTSVLELTERVGILEGQYASISRRVDRIGGDVDLIKKRLNLADAVTS
jgi:hypothetical protein